MTEISATDYYQTHLDEVSRSFAYSISVLEEPLREYTGLAYLLCRLIDTIEDAAWENSRDQTTAFLQLKAALFSKNKITDFQTQFQASQISNGELALLNDAPKLLENYHALPAVIRTHLRRLTVSMIEGMMLKSLDLNTYCFFVAGIVGEALSCLVTSIDPSFKLTHTFLKNAYAFGLFLQKVNILKDQNKDEAEGRHFVISREDVFVSTLQHIKNVEDYIAYIPASQKAYKIFCLSAFLLGLKTLEILDPKIPQTKVLDRRQTENLFLELVAIADDSKLVHQKIVEFKKTLPKYILKKLEQNQKQPTRANFNLYKNILRKDKLLEPMS